MEVELDSKVRPEDVAAFSAHCLHGGRSFDRIGNDFLKMQERENLVPSDVLDAWYPPCPGALEAMRTHLEWGTRTSPPPRAEGLKESIAKYRGTRADQIVLGSGSSDLIFRALPLILNDSGPVVLPSPVYGEYFHVLHTLYGRKVIRYQTESSGFQIDIESLASFAIETSASSIVLVNPCNPTGQFIERNQVLKLLDLLPAHVKLVIDETYIDYLPGQSLEKFVGSIPNLIIIKSMSKVYALSGLRAGYMVLDATLAKRLDALTPPYAVSTLAQMAAIESLKDPNYFSERLSQTAAFREQLRAELTAIEGLRVLPGIGNFFLIDLEGTKQTASFVSSVLSAQGIFVRSIHDQGLSDGERFLRLAVLGQAENSKMAEAIFRLIP